MDSAVLQPFHYISTLGHPVSNDFCCIEGTKFYIGNLDLMFQLQRTGNWVNVI